MKKYIFYVLVGACILGLGTKLARVYWLDFEWPHPNFIDAIASITAGVTLLILGFKPLLSWAKGGLWIQKNDYNKTNRR